MRHTPAAIRQFLEDHSSSGQTVADSNKGAQRAAMMYSFFASCKEHDINPSDWLKDVLKRIGSHKVNRLAELLPGA